MENYPLKGTGGREADDEDLWWKRISNRILGGIGADLGNRQEGRSDQGLDTTCAGDSTVIRAGVILLGLSLVAAARAGIPKGGGCARNRQVPPGLR
jgi:hypothetical protein